MNIWTQSIQPKAKKPVLVWLHGGAFVAGSSIEQVAYDGENMSIHGDVVVVSINHRLNILGYLDLAPFGDKYANSANAGNADIVAALQWINENIAAFGGDPDNVTIFGQSGGGAKVWSLLQTPSADGLFTEHARTIPLMVGSVMGEFAFGPGVAGKHMLSEDEIKPMIVKKYAESSDQLIDLFKKAYPDKNLSDLLFIDSLFRLPTVEFIRKRATYKEAPVFSYLFAYDFPYDDGKPAWHCSEIPFVFHNTDKVYICNEPGVSDRLEDCMFSAWINFARYGNPNVPTLPEWPSSEENDEAVMVFDKNCEVRHNFDHELLELHKKAAPMFLFGQETVLH